MNEARIATTGASLNRHKSNQAYETPPDFLAAVRHRFGALRWDLAATAENAKAPEWIGPVQDSLSVDWSPLKGNLWLNPPFANIAPWAAKCAATNLRPHSRILLLVPASVGANWFAAHVHRRALVLGLQGRITFVGCDQPYPKDCVLCVYGVGLSGFDVWAWTKDPR